MKEYVLDANALTGYLKVSDASGGEGVRELFATAQKNEARLSMSVINLGEVLYILIRHIGEERALHYIRVLQHGIAIVDADASACFQLTF